MVLMGLLSSRMWRDRAYFQNIGLKAIAAAATLIDGKPLHTANIAVKLRRTCKTFLVKVYESFVGALEGRHLVRVVMYWHEERNLILDSYDDL